jgi:hypothetical protein
MDENAVTMLDKSEIPMPKRKARKSNQLESTVLRMDDGEYDARQQWCTNMQTEAREMEAEYWNSLSYAAADHNIAETTKYVSAIKRLRTIIHELEYLAHLV